MGHLSPDIVNFIYSLTNILLITVVMIAVYYICWSFVERFFLNGIANKAISTTKKAILNDEKTNEKKPEEIKIT